MSDRHLQHISSNDAPIASDAPEAPNNDEPKAPVTPDDETTVGHARNAPILDGGGVNALLLPPLTEAPISAACNVSVDNAPVGDSTEAPVAHVSVESARPMADEDGKPVAFVARASFVESPVSDAPIGETSSSNESAAHVVGESNDDSSKAPVDDVPVSKAPNADKSKTPIEPISRAPIIEAHVADAPLHDAFNAEVSEAPVTDALEASIVQSSDASNGDKCFAEPPVAFVAGTPFIDSPNGNAPIEASIGNESKATVDGAFNVDASKTPVGDAPALKKLNVDESKGPISSVARAPFDEAPVAWAPIYEVFNMDEPEAPVGDVREAPVGNVLEAPVGDEPDVPVGDEPDVPVGDESYVPVGDKPDVPTGDETDAPVGYVLEAPVGVEPDAPVGDTPVVLVSNEIESKETTVDTPQTPIGKAHEASSFGDAFEASANVVSGAPAFDTNVALIANALKAPFSDAPVAEDSIEDEHIETVGDALAKLLGDESEAPVDDASDVGAINEDAPGGAVVDTPQAPVSDAPEAPVDGEPGKPVDGAPGEPVDGAPGEPVDGAPGEPVGNAPGEPVGNAPETPVSDAPVIEASNEVATEETAVYTPQASVGNAPVAPIGDVPGALVGDCGVGNVDAPEAVAAAANKSPLIPSVASATLPNDNQVVNNPAPTIGSVSPNASTSSIVPRPHGKPIEGVPTAASGAVPKKKSLSKSISFSVLSGTKKRSAPIFSGNQLSEVPRPHGLLQNPNVDGVSGNQLSNEAGHFVAQGEQRPSDSSGLSDHSQTMRTAESMPAISQNRPSRYRSLLRTVKKFFSRNLSFNIGRRRQEEDSRHVMDTDSENSREQPLPPPPPAQKERYRTFPKGTYNYFFMHDPVLPFNEVNKKCVTEWKPELLYDPNVNSESEDISSITDFVAEDLEANPVPPDSASIADPVVQEFEDDFVVIDFVANPIGNIPEDEMVVPIVHAEAVNVEAHDPVAVNEANVLHIPDPIEEVVQNNADPVSVDGPIGANLPDPSA